MIRMLGSLLLPPRCGCGALGQAPCAECWHAIGGRSREVQVEGLATTWAAVPYHGAGNRLVSSYKTGNRSLVRWASTVVADLIPAEVVAQQPVVTWIPASVAGRRLRGRDQGRDLAVGVGRLLDLPVVRSLSRVGSRSQTGSGRAERLRGPPLRTTRRLDGIPLLVVDDVITTGSSMRRTGEVLRQAGAADVWGAALAWADHHRNPPEPEHHPMSGYSIG